MAKKKAGLHKKVSSIFEGVPIPGQKVPMEEKTPGSGKSPTKDREPAVSQSRQILREPVPDTKQQEKKPPKHVPAKTAEKPPAAFGRKEYKLTAPFAGAGGTKEKIKLAMLPILSIILVMVLISAFNKGSGSSKTSATSTKDSKNVQKTEDTDGMFETETTVNPNVTITWKPPDKYPNELRDPMVISGSNGSLTKAMTMKNGVPIGGPGSVEYVNIVIRSILYSADGRSVIIGDEILSEGDTVSGALIKKINKDDVEFEKNGKKFSIKLLRIKSN